MRELTKKEIEFISKINLIVESCNCRMIYCDPDTRKIEIEGHQDNELQCSIALSEYFEGSPDIKELKEVEILLDNAPKIVQVTNNVSWLV